MYGSCFVGAFGGVNLFVKNNGLSEKYGLCKSRVQASKMLFYIPVLILLTGNLWYGIVLNFSPLETILYILTMFCVGFLEEMIFRGFLFNAMIKDGIKSAVIVSSVTFGIGHIINLINGSGAELLLEIGEVPMKKVVIIGGGIAGMTAGVLLQKAGFQTEIYEKNALPGGQCTGWKREGYMIDNCIHWLTGTRPGSALHELWKEIGALGDDVDIHEKEMFFSSRLNGQTLTFWRDKERTRKEMLILSPEDEKEINKLMDYVELAETMTVPVEKPFDAMNLIDLMKLGMSMKAMGKVMKEYGGMDIKELAQRFKHPLIQRAIIDYMPSGYQAYTFLVSYGTVTGGNGDIPKGGSLAMSLRIAERYRDYGGKLYTNTEVEKITLNGRMAEGIVLKDGTKINGNYVVCACDTDYTFSRLLPAKYMPKGLGKMYRNRTDYPVSSGFQIAYAVDGVFPEITGTRVFSCKEITVGSQMVQSMSIQSYDYEPTFAPEGKMILQTNFSQSEKDYKYWESLYIKKEVYHKRKNEIAQQAMERVIAEYPFLDGKIRILDVWSPMTYARYCNSYKGAYMSFVTTKGAKSITVPGRIKGLKNVQLASQWLMGPGGLPTAAAMGKFAAWRIINSI